MFIYFAIKCLYMIHCLHNTCMFLIWSFGFSHKARDYGLLTSECFLQSFPILMVMTSFPILIVKACHGLFAIDLKGSRIAFDELGELSQF